VATEIKPPLRTEQTLFDTVVRRLHTQGAPCYKTTLDEWDPHACTINMNGHVSAVTALLPIEKLTKLRRMVGYDKLQSMTPASMREVWTPLQDSDPAPRDPYIAEYRTMEFLEAEGISTARLLGFTIRLEEAHQEVLLSMIKDKAITDYKCVSTWFDTYLDMSFRRVALAKYLSCTVLNFSRP